MVRILLVSPSKAERDLGPCIQVKDSPDSLDTTLKDNENAHLERGQAVFRAFLKAFPDAFTTLDYTKTQAMQPGRILHAINGKPSSETNDGYAYRAGSDRSFARIRNTKAGVAVYELTGQWETTLRNLERSAERTTEGKERLEAQRSLAEPFGPGTGHFAEYVARVHAIDANLLGSDRFWQRLVALTHLTTKPPLKPDGFFARFGKTSLYTVNILPRADSLPDTIIGIQAKEDKGRKAINQTLRHFGTAIDQHGELLLFAEVANVKQPVAA